MKTKSKIMIAMGSILLLCLTRATYADPVDGEGTRGIVEVNSWLNVREGPGMDYDVITELADQSICRIIEIHDDWAYMDFYGTEGYVSMDYMRLLGRTEIENTEVDAKEDIEEDTKESMEPESTEEAEGMETVESHEAVASGMDIRRDMVDFALQYVGNPYVWGGTSLTEGADCSGFVQSVYAQYGIELPRTSGEQAYAGERIDIADALPGDLIFYADENGDIYHVVMYMGDGEVVQAASTAAGIITSEINYDKAVWAERYFSS